MATKTATTRTKRESYWERRTLERELSWHKKSQDTVEKELAAYYRQSLKVIEKDIEALYGTYMQDNKLSYRDAVRLLHGNDFRSWRMSMEDYITAIGTDKDSPLLRELNTLAMRSRISRLDRLHSETLMELDKLGRKSLSAMDKFLGKAYKDNYYRGLFDIGKAGEMLQAVSKVDAAKLEGILRTPWSGKNYSQRIWQNTDKLGKTIQDTIVAGLHRGDSPQKMVKLVSEKMGVGQSDAERLVRTELNYVQNQAALDSIQDAGMEFYQFCATLDTRTTLMCREHDGNIYPVEDAQPGENMPPLHPRCRSTIFASLEEKPTSRPGKRAARDRADRTIMVPADMTYKDWKAVFVDNTKTLADFESFTKSEPDVIIKTGMGTSISAFQETLAKQKAAGASAAEIEKTIINAGSTVREDFEKLDFAKPIDRQALLRESLDVRSEWANADPKDKPGLWNRMQELELKIKNLPQINAEIPRTNAKMVFDFLSQYREMGAPSDLIKKQFGRSRSIVHDVAEEGLSYYPRAWIEKSVKRGPISLKKTNRGYYSERRREIAISRLGVDGMKTAIHESAHMMERVIPDIMSAEREFYSRRTKGCELEKLKDLVKGVRYKDNELTRADKFINPYMGKDYSGTAYELASMGFEDIFTEPEAILRDPDMANWLLGMLVLF